MRDGEREKVRLTLDLNRGSYNALKAKIRRTNDANGSANRVNLTGIVHTLAYSWLAGEINLPSSTVRLTFDLPVGSYLRFRDTINAANAGLGGRSQNGTRMPGPPHRLTQANVLRHLLYQELLHDSKDESP